MGLRRHSKGRSITMDLMHALGKLKQDFLGLPEYQRNTVFDFTLKAKKNTIPNPYQIQSNTLIKLITTLSQLYTGEHPLGYKYFQCLLAFMYGLMVSCKTTLLVKLQVALPANVFDSFIYCPLMFSKVYLPGCLIVAQPTREFDPFMYCPFVLSKSSPLRKLQAIICTRVFDFFMYCPFVFI